MKHFRFETDNPIFISKLDLQLAKSKVSHLEMKSVNDVTTYDVLESTWKALHFSYQNVFISVLSVEYPSGPIGLLLSPPSDFSDCSVAKTKDSSALIAMKKAALREINAQCSFF